MPSFLHRNSASAAPARSDLEEEIRRLENRSQAETGHMRARLLNQVGDLCVQAGDVERAKRYFGRTIDAYLEAGYFEAAAAICRKVIRISPDVVRARATLALIYLGKKLVQNAEYEVELVQDYIRAAHAAGETELLVFRLRVMTQATENQELRVLLGQQLMELGDEEFGRQVLYSIYREVSGLEEPRDLDPEEQWERLLKAATMSPSDLRHQELSPERQAQPRTSRPGAAALPGMMSTETPLPAAPIAPAASPPPAAPTPVPVSAPTPAPQPPHGGTPSGTPSGADDLSLSLDLPGDASAPAQSGPAGTKSAGGAGGAADDLPALDGDLPMLGGDLPSLGGDRPATGGDLPSLGGGDLPSLGGDLATGGDLAMGGDLPSMDLDPPAADRDPPTTGGGLPGLESDLSDFGNISLDEPKP